MKNIEYIYSRRARSVRIRVSATHIRVSVPVGMRMADAERFVARHAAEIAERQQRLREQTPQPTLITPEQPLQTLTFVAEARPDDKLENIRFRFAAGQLLMFYPPAMDMADLQPLFWKGITYCLRKEAKRILPPRVAALATEHGFQYTGLKIQSSRTRWGSCSSRKSLNLSYFLLLLPEQLVDYVILHELCHTVELNHGPRFHALLDHVTGGKDKMLHNELKRYRIPDM